LRFIAACGHRPLIMELAGLARDRIAGVPSASPLPRGRLS
jgi:hypothetical protein